MKRLIVSLLALVVLGTACADVTTDALSVNGETTSRSDLLALIEDLRAPVPDGAPETGTADCRARDTAVVVTIQNAAAHEALAERGGSITDGDRADAVIQADQLIGEGQLDETARDFIVETVSVGLALSRVAPEGFNAATDAVLAEADIHIDPRFGTWTDGIGYTPLSPCL